jgi:hypothetical protein
MGFLHDLKRDLNPKKNGVDKFFKKDVKPVAVNVGRGLVKTIPKVGGILGAAAGTAIGGLSSVGVAAPVGGVVGSAVGTSLGESVQHAIPKFRTGGPIGRRGGLIMVHPNEYVLPANAKPTAAQKAVVAANRRRLK